MWGKGEGREGGREGRGECVGHEAVCVCVWGGGLTLDPHVAG